MYGVRQKQRWRGATRRGLQSGAWDGVRTVARGSDSSFAAQNRCPTPLTPPPPLVHFTPQNRGRIPIDFLARMKQKTWTKWVVVLALTCCRWRAVVVPADAAGEVQYRTAKIERGPLIGHGVGQRTVNPSRRCRWARKQWPDQRAVCGLQLRGQRGQLTRRSTPETFEYCVRSAQADADAAQAAVLTAQANGRQPRWWW